MLAVQVAAQIVVRGRSLSASSTSLQSLLNDYNLIGWTSISGILPVTFTQLCLHKAGMRSWYLLVLSLLTVIVSATTLYAIGSFDVEPRDLEAFQLQVTEYEACGRRNPMTYCLERDDAWKPLLGGTYLIIFCSIIMAALIAGRLGLQRSSYNIRVGSRIAAFTTSILRKLNSKRQVSAVLRSLRVDTTERLYSRAANLLVFFLWLWFLLHFLFFLFSLHVGVGVNITAPEWTFGQIVALTVWVAPLVEGLKLLSRR